MHSCIKLGKHNNPTVRHPTLLQLLQLFINIVITKLYLNVTRQTWQTWNKASIIWPL